MPQNTVNILCEDRRWKLRESVFASEPDCFYHHVSYDSDWYDILENNTFELLIAPDNAEAIIDYLRGYHQNYALLGKVELHNLYLDANRFNITGLVDILSEMHVVPTLVRRSDIESNIEIGRAGIESVYSVIPELNAIIPKEILMELMSKFMTSPLIIWTLNDEHSIFAAVGMLSVLTSLAIYTGIIHQSMIINLITGLLSLCEVENETISSIVNIFGTPTPTSTSTSTFVGTDNATPAEDGTINTTNGSVDPGSESDEDIYQPPTSSHNSWQHNISVDFINNIVESVMLQIPQNEDFTDQTNDLMNALHQNQNQNPDEDLFQP